MPKVFFPHCKIGFNPKMRSVILSKSRNNGQLFQSKKLILLSTEKTVNIVAKSVPTQLACPRLSSFLGTTISIKYICAFQKCSSFHSMQGSSSCRIGSACPHLSNGCCACCPSYLDDINPFQRIYSIFYQMLRNPSWILIYNPLLVLLIMYY